MPPVPPNWRQDQLAAAKWRLMQRNRELNRTRDEHRRCSEQRQDVAKVAEVMASTTRQTLDETGSGETQRAPHGTTIHRRALRLEGES